MKPLYIITALAVACGAHAQDINREITVDRELLPVEKDARRLPLVPEVTLPAVPAARLSTTQRAVTTDVPATVRLLDPAECGIAGGASQSRGYIAVGLGAPMFDGALSAGYRFVDTKSTRIGAWLQWDSRVYSRRGAWWRTHAAAIGVDAVHRFGPNSLLEASASWTFDRHNMPRVAERRYWLTSNRADVSAAWHSAAGSLNYNVDARYGWFGYAAPSVALPISGIKGTKQNRFGIGGDAWLPISDFANAGLRVDLDLLATSACAAPMPGSATYLAGSSTVGVFTLTPQWRLHTDVWTLALGPRIDFSFNADKAFHIAPAVEAAWTPSSFFAVGVRAGGGEHVNSLADLSQSAMRQVPYTAPGISHLPFTADADITVGPWHGVWLRLYGGWAKANSWAMPVAAEGDLQAGILWACTDISGGHVGAEIGAKVRSWLELKAAYTAAPSDYDNAWYLNRDRARHVVDAGVNFSPVSALDVAVTYQLRAGRAIYLTDAVSGPMGFTSYSHTRVNPGNMSLLGVNVSYRFNESLTVFARGENLLGRDALQLDLTPQQGVHGLIGASLKF